MIYSAIVPIKANSNRLPGKNFKAIGSKLLYEYVLDTLGLIDSISEIIIDTDCAELLQDYVRLKGVKYKLIKRPENLLGDGIVMNALLMNNLLFAENQHILQTHVTNPLLSSHTIQLAMKTYESGIAEFDSLISVSRHQKRFYFENGNPINHDFEEMLSTQNLKPVFEENSNLFIFSKQSFNSNAFNRVGKKPFLFETNKLESIDIDEADEFKLAQLLIINQK
jgi:CMP-N-acetylneuraminic acid synthetase